MIEYRGYQIKIEQEGDRWNWHIDKNGAPIHSRYGVVSEGLAIYDAQEQVDEHIAKPDCEDMFSEPTLKLTRDDVLRLGSLIYTARNQNIFDFEGTVQANMYMHLFEAFLEHECGVDGSVPAAKLLNESEG